MGDITRKKIYCYDWVSVSLALLLFAYLIAISLHNMNYQYDEKIVRVEVNRMVIYFNAHLKDKNFENTPECNYPYSVYDQNGTVLYTTVKNRAVGEKTDISTSGSINQYVVPLQDEETQGYMMVDTSAYRKSYLQKHIWSQIIFPALLVCGIFLMQVKKHRVMQKDIFEPINEIHRSTRAILRGSYEESVTYDYQGEMGELCHDFEKMRDEIKNSNLCASKAREKERILYASISHDLKTPLAIINGYLEQILYGVISKPEEIKETIAQILKKTEVTNKLIDDIMQHSKAELNQLSIVKQGAYADVFFGNLLQEYAVEAEKLHYTLQYQLPTALQIEIDPDRISQVMQNIIGNAIKYSKDNLIIQVKFEEIIQKNRLLIVSVTDNGIGIDASDLPFVFNLFYRGNSARVKDIHGSGMGLHISQYIVSKHGGTIECDSIAGVGTTISFSIPIS